MPEYPVHVPRDRYHGRDEARRVQSQLNNELAAELERHVNERFEASNEDCVQFLHAHIARDLSVPVERVRKLLFGLEGGHNGFSVWRSRWRFASRPGE